MKKFLKKNIIPIIIFVAVLVIVTITFALVLTNANNINENTTQNENTSNVIDKGAVDVALNISKEKNEIKNINYYDLNIIQDESFILIITKEGCPSCERFDNNLKDFVNKYNVPVYCSQFEDLNDEDKVKYSVVPAWKFYKNGECIYSDYGNVKAEYLYKKFIEKTEGK